jgi:hypothetical protein
LTLGGDHPPEAEGWPGGGAARRRGWLRARRGIAGTFAMTLTLNEVHDTPCAASLSILRQVIVLSGAGNITKKI